MTRRRARRHLSTRDASRGRARARRDATALGVSTTTLVLAIGAGALALGPRDVPVAAKFLGRLTGRAVAHVGGVARAIERATNERELRGIRAEVRASMKDLRINNTQKLVKKIDKNFSIENISYKDQKVFDLLSSGKIGRAHV